MAVHVHLAQFDGPLDLLLHLVGQAKIALQDIFISTITEQYIAIVREAPDFDMEEASEFLTMAALLIEIKSRHILPKPQTEQEEDPEEVLLARLRAYQQFKQASLQIGALESASMQNYAKLPEEYPLPPPTFSLEGLTIADLWNAYLRLQNRTPKQAPEVNFHLRDIRRDSFTLEGCMEAIESRLSVGKVRFEDLFTLERDKEEVVTLFIALLELLKLGKAHVVQEGLFAELTVLAGRNEYNNDSES